MSLFLQCAPKAARSAASCPGGILGSRLLVTLAVPYLLMVGNARLLTSEWFVRVEYSRPGFPEDSFGMSSSDRLMYGVYCIRYMTNGEGIDYLKNLTLPHDMCHWSRRPAQKTEGCQMFTEKELSHMQDVKALSGALFVAFWGLLVLAAVAVAFLLHAADSKVLKLALLRGSQLTLGLILAVSIFALLGFKTLFRWFHVLFFTGDSWLFSFRDTLIRLYPRQFWLDATLILSCSTLVLSMAATIVFRGSRLPLHPKEKSEDHV